MALNTIFRWLQDAIIPRNPADPDFLQLVAASTFRCVTTALAPAFQIEDQIGGLNLNHRKYFWVQFGSESC